MRFLSIAVSIVALAALGACAQTPGNAAATATGVAKTTLPSGVIFESMQAGSGPSPKATDSVKVHYRGTFTDGKEFDSSYKRGQPISFPLNRVIPCWTEAVQLMKPGGKARLTCPPQTAYGPSGRPGIPPNSTLIFDIELLGINS
ncbi:FKBP-type peptidyl-prolyl cis-trans isomerase [Ramlibacter alkalitolerans]|uniref:Peptidyl-prolyl cis-trans isomerase n=1 Tax=Ramlibacter alkalitolerans TaxID=2039631 RepID=A0ABS1JR55_9BURK|nr:FKBP-type peptidyl-prolyl cis-trans isomerase [Ramlibacter alkalitolerans]MBL0426755.1 FKBP-type peptidyl-prolyl cis-trans isomerase [Ramlibacter alkalitolerans]